MSGCLVLTGAGSSMDAGLPGAFELTSQLDAYLSAHDSEGALRAFRFVCGGLLMGRGLRAESPLDNLNVEEVFTAMQVLSERETLDIAPFIGSWHSGVELVDKHSGPLYPMTNSRFLSALNDYVEERMTSPDTNHAGSGLSERLLEVIEEATGLRTGTGFGVAAILMLEGLKTALEPRHVTDMDYLLPLIELASSPQCQGIATLNYDVCIEMAAASAGQPISTAAEQWSESGVLEFPTGAINLLKLHGSLSWRWDRISKPLPALGMADRIREDVSGTQHPLFPVLLFGQGMKSSHEGPFADILWDFRRRLRETQTLLVLGYSFRDEHINHHIARWFDGNPSRRMVILTPSFRPDTNDFCQGIAGLVPSRVRVVEGRTREALREAIAVTQELIG